jgi:hypothetical protein
MQHVLVHTDASLGPIGAWSYQPETQRLTHFYPESLDLHISGRARQLMAERPDETTPSLWFAYMVERSTTLDAFALVVVGDEVDLVDVVSEYRRVWNTTV